MVKEQAIIRTPITRGRTLDHVAYVYDILSPPMTFFQESRIGKKAASLLNLKGTEKILDIGCGTGTLTIQIAKMLQPDQGGLIVGLDAAPKMLQKARKKAAQIPQIRFDLAAAEKLPYPGEYFDCAISTFFFHHVDLELKKKTLDELWRVIRRQGRVIIVDVDIPTTLFGKLCAYLGYVLFRQPEIKENIDGKLRLVITESRFKSFKIVAAHLGYVSIFELIKGD